jgi:hypothetical protein
MWYDPNSKAARQELAYALLAGINTAGFQHEEIPGTHEAVYSRPVDGKRDVRILVYTSIIQGTHGPEVRTCGTDAIRVCAVYRNKLGQDRGIAKAEARVNRTGEIEQIASRTLDRMRGVWKEARGAKVCPQCGAPCFISKKGNEVCADTCWVR